MSIESRINNCHNEWQDYDRYKRVLCICTAGLLRSPTVALILSQEPFNFNTRSAGLNPEYALIPVDEVLMQWADEIVVMEPGQIEILKTHFGPTKTPIVCLDLEDCYGYRDTKLMELVKDRYKEKTNFQGV